eukprot:4680446-Pleurochrysis_carterae.AAC.2
MASSFLLCGLPSPVTFERGSPCFDDSLIASLASIFHNLHCVLIFCTHHTSAIYLLVETLVGTFGVIFLTWSCASCERLID